MSRKKLLWIGDAGVPSGFARATHEILDDLSQVYDVTVLGLNYRGDPHQYPYPIYAAAAGGDSFGVGRLIWMCDLVKPDLIIIQQDPWNFRFYLDQLARFAEYKHVPVVGAVAVDGVNCLGKELNRLAMSVFWTEFGRTEAARGGHTGRAAVIPLGVDTSTYRPMLNSRDRLPDGVRDAFIIGNVNRNQPRKRLDLTVRYFAKWFQMRQPEDAYLYMHVAPTGDTGVDVEKLATYYGVLDQLILVRPATWYGETEEELALTYNRFDVAISTTQGEGWGLPALEAMACGVPCILPDYAALGEWAKDAAVLVPCTSTAIGPPYVNVIGGIPDEAAFIAALDNLYLNPDVRATHAHRGLALACSDRFRWSTIGRQWVDLLAQIPAGQARGAVPAGQAVALGQPPAAAPTEPATVQA